MYENRNIYKQSSLSNTQETEKVSRGTKMKYTEFDEIKAKISEKETSLVMLQEMNKLTKKLISQWGTDGQTYRVM